MISFTKEEFKGVPSDTVSGYNKRSIEVLEDVYDVTFKTPDVFLLFRYAENPDVWKTEASRKLSVHMNEPRSEIR